MSAACDTLDSAKDLLDGIDIPTWQGPAASAYRAWLSGTQSAIDLVKGGVDDLSDHLLEHSRAVDSRMPDFLESLSFGGFGDDLVKATNGLIAAVEAGHLP